MLSQVEPVSACSDVSMGQVQIYHQLHSCVRAASHFSSCMRLDQTFGSQQLLTKGKSGFLLSFHTREKCAALEEIFVCQLCISFGRCPNNTRLIGVTGVIGAMHQKRTLKRDHLGKRATRLELNLS